MVTLVIVSIYCALQWAKQKLDPSAMKYGKMLREYRQHFECVLFLKNLDQEEQERGSYLEERKESWAGRDPIALKVKRKEPVEKKVSRFKK